MTNEDDMLQRNETSQNIVCSLDKNLTVKDEGNDDFKIHGKTKWIIKTFIKIRQLMKISKIDSPSSVNPHVSGKTNKTKNMNSKKLHKYGS